MVFTHKEGEDDGGGGDEDEAERERLVAVTQLTAAHKQT